MTFQHLSQALFAASRHRFWLLFSACLAACVRLLRLDARPLWCDELQSVTYSSLSLPDVLAAVRAFDPHPPLYYLQLHLWLALGQNDAWIKLNSVAWSLLGLALLYALCEHLFDRRLAAAAAVVYAISPFAIFYAQEARMYAMLMCLGLGGVFFAQRFLFIRQGWQEALGYLLFSAAFLYSQGAGFMLLVSIYAYAAWVRLADKSVGWQPIVRFAGLQGVLLLLYLPWLARAADIRVGHTLRPTLADIILTLSQLLLGFNAYPDWLRWLAVAALLGGLILAGVRRPALRAMLAGVVGAAILFCIAVSYLDRPLWLHRTLAYLLPFICIGLASAGLELADRLAALLQRLWGARPQLSALAQTGLLVGLAGLLLAATLGQQMQFAYPWRIRDAANYLQAHAQPGQVIYIVNERVWWGFNWYFLGPGSVNPLRTDYDRQSPNQVRLLSKPALERLDPTQGYWLLYRSIDDLAPLQLDPAAPRHDFERLYLVWVAGR